MSDYEWRSELTVKMFGVEELVVVETKRLKATKRYRTSISASPIPVVAKPWYEPSDEGALETHNRIVAVLQNNYELEKYISIDKVEFSWPKMQEVSE